MPFRSISQLSVCYSKRGFSKEKGLTKSRFSRGSWNCDKWLDETPSVCCLPYEKGDKVKSRCMKNGERIVGKVQTGPRGGKFFTITEKDKKGKVCTIKVYLPKK